MHLSRGRFELCNPSCKLFEGPCCPRPRNQIGNLAANPETKRKTFRVGCILGIARGAGRTVAIARDFSSIPHESPESTRNFVRRGTPLVCRSVNKSSSAGPANPDRLRHFAPSVQPDPQGAARWIWCRGPLHRVKNSCAIVPRLNQDKTMRLVPAHLARPWTDIAVRSQLGLHARSSCAFLRRTGGARSESRSTPPVKRPVRPTIRT